MEKKQMLIWEGLKQVNRTILGKEEEVRQVMLAFLANGHVLLEDIPGVGKTMLALAFSRIMQLKYHRVQFTPDVLPSDLTGFSIYKRRDEQFVYQPGSLFCNLLLADEINRTSPKTQSALLEAMQERKVTAEGRTRRLPEPFLVIATQNPLGAAGTQSLPEAQMDRFMIRMSMGYPDFDSELRLAMEVGDTNRLEHLYPVIDEGMLVDIQREVCGVYIKESVYRYIVELVRATREHAHLEQGASPRATIALVRMARASAWLEGRTYVRPDDVAEQFPYVIWHRIIRNNTARVEQKDKAEIIRQVLESVKKPSLGERL